MPYLPLGSAVVLAVVLAVRGTGVDRFEACLGIAVVSLVLVRQLMTIVQNTRLLARVQEGRRELHYQAFHDPLTGLANRALFTDRLRHAVELNGRAGWPIALLFCDLDDFKEVNDSLGHAAGDELLVTVARRLRACVRAADTVARLGGDEFAVLLEGGGDDAEIIGRRIADVVSRPFTVVGKRCRPRASVGLALATPADRPGGAEMLLHHADAAMYAAKRQGHGGLVVYQPGMAVTEPGHGLRDGLAVALAGEGVGGHLEVHYQPITRLRDRRVVAVEALVRWFHPTRGLIPPTEFIPAAEQNGLVTALDDFVLDRVCADIRPLRARYGDDLAVHVNVSAVRVSDPDLAETVEATLRRHLIHPDALVVEVTETGRIPDLTAARSVLWRLAEQGVRIALDDVGSGHSSIAALHRLPLDIVKLDRCLVVSPNDRCPGGRCLDNRRPGNVCPGDDTTTDKVRHAIVALAQTLDMTVVAEGVEDAAQLEAIAAAGCDYGQGYYLGRPQALHAVTPQNSSPPRSYIPLSIVNG